MTSDEARIRFLTTPVHILPLAWEQTATANGVAAARESRGAVISPFVETKGSLALHIRIGNVDAPGSHGVVGKLDREAAGIHVRMTDAGDWL